MQALAFATPPSRPTPPKRCAREVRDFLATELRDRTPQQRAESWSGHDRAFSRKMGQRGWLGMTWPKQYGGHERSALERYVVLEEMLAAGAPVGYHWVADRQSGPSILQNGTEAQREPILPQIAAGECSFCIGMSEPDSGSDLAAARTRAQRGAGRLAGERHQGLDVRRAQRRLHDPVLPHRRQVGRRPACRRQPVPGGHEAGAAARHDGAPDHRHARRPPFQRGRPSRTCCCREDALLGKEGDGWKQVTGELAFERSGPDRFLSAFTLLVERCARSARTRRTGRPWRSAG